MSKYVFNTRDESHWKLKTPVCPCLSCVFLSFRSNHWPGFEVYHCHACFYTFIMYVWVYEQYKIWFKKLYEKDRKLYLFCTLRENNSHIIWDLFLLIHSASSFFKQMYVLFHCMIILHYLSLLLLSDIFGMFPDFRYCIQRCCGCCCTCLLMCACEFLWGHVWVWNCWMIGCEHLQLPAYLQPYCVPHCSTH